MTRAVNASLDPQRVAEALLTRAATWIPAPAWLVLTIDAQGELRPMATRGLKATAEPTARAIARVVIRSGEIFTAANASADRRVSNGLRVAALGFPLTARGRTIGALIALDRRPATKAPMLTESAQAVLDAALEPCAAALDNAMRVQRAEALSLTDDLTSLYNSRFLGQVLRRETKRAIRGNRPLSLLFVDLDGFKSINDTHGHLYGSRALVEAATVIKASARETDMVARFGGDEFAVVLPETAVEGAKQVGERIRDRIAAHGFLRPDGLDIKLTVSVGVATLRDASESVESLIEAADKAMYRVKDHGKNGIFVAGSDI